MNKLLKYWNQNKRKILITVAVIAFVLIIIQMMNAIIKSQNGGGNDNTPSKPITANDITKPNQSVTSNEKLNQKQTEDNSSLIKQFVDYCNQNKIEEAYSLLTEDCKAELYPNKEVFASNYRNYIFQKPVNYELELWNTASNCYTYKIIYNEGNLLQTGGNLSTNNFMDYITLIKENGTYKLNIHKFVKKENLNKKGSNKGIEVQIHSKSIYLDYEIYHMTVENHTQKTILLNDGTNANDFCLIGNNSQFSSMISETPMSSLTLNPQYHKTIDVKFNKVYMTQNEIQSMQMTNVYLDKEQYDTKQQNPEKITININL